MDLDPINADPVHHPEFHGSFAIKSVLPALVRDLSFDDLIDSLRIRFLSGS